MFTHSLTRRISAIFLTGLFATVSAQATSHGTLPFRAITSPASSVANTSAVIGGYIAIGDATHYRIDHKVSSDPSFELGIVEPAVHGSHGAEYTTTLSGTPGSLYIFRFCATEAGSGSSWVCGDELRVLLPDVTAVTVPAYAVTSTSANVGGYIATGVANYYKIESKIHGTCSSSYALVGPLVGSSMTAFYGTSSVIYLATMTGTSGTTYDFHICATGSGLDPTVGWECGSDLTVTLH